MWGGRLKYGSVSKIYEVMSVQRVVMRVLDYAETKKEI